MQRSGKANGQVARISMPEHARPLHPDAMQGIIALKAWVGTLGLEPSVRRNMLAFAMNHALAKGTVPTQEEMQKLFALKKAGAK